MKNLYPTYPPSINPLANVPTEEKYKVLIEKSLSAFFLTIPDGTILETNDAAIKMFGYTADEFKNISRQDIIDHTDDNIAKALQEREKYGFVKLETTGIKKNGQRFPVEIFSVLFTNTDGDIRSSTLITDITESRRLRELERIEKKVLENNARNNSKIETILAYYLREIEKIHPGMICSVLQLQHNRLYNWSSPSLPKNYCTAIEGAMIGNNAGSCGTAAYKKEKVIVTDIENDIRWADYKAYALKEGLRSCWSFPIINTKGDVLGTFAIYYKEIRVPLKEEEKTIERARNILAAVLENKMAEAAMRLSNERYNLVVKATNDLVWDWDLVNGKIYRSSHGLKEVYGHITNEKISSIQSWSDFLHPQDKNRIMDKIQYYTHSKTESSFRFEYRFRQDDGTYSYINDRGYIIRNHQGDVVRMIGAAEDITERKKAEKAIAESEQRYKMFVQQSTEGIWRIELAEVMHIDTPVEELITYFYNHAHLAECNDVFAQMYGFANAAEIIGIPLKKIMPASNVANRNFLNKFITGGFKITDAISYEMDKDGNQVIFENNMVGIIENNYLQRTWGTQKNITVQVKIEKALKENETLLRTIVQTVPESIGLLNEQGELLEINAAGLAMIEADNLQQVVGKKAATMVLPVYYKPFNKLLNDVFKGRSTKLIFEITGLKGTRRWMESNAVPLRNDKKKIIAALCVTRDVTENKRAAALLETSVESYKYLFNNNPSSIIIWDIDDLRVIEVNETAIDLYGYAREEFLQLTVLDIYPAAEQAVFAELIHQARESDLLKKTMKWHHINKAGNKMIMEISSHTINYNGKKAVLALGNNVTEKVLLENSLMEERKIRQQQITDAVITGQEKERVEIGQELHDNINQILATSKLYLEYALAQKSFRHKLVNESKVLTEKAMMEIRKLSNSLLPPSLQEIGLLEALNDLVKNIKAVNTLKIITNWDNFLEAPLDEKLKLTIFRIIQEQLNNIIKHANATKAKISIVQKNGQLCLRIEDDGIGFDTTQKRTGVGLKNIISRSEVNNGKVSIQSKPGEGCVIAVCFTAD